MKNGLHRVKQVTAAVTLAFAALTVPSISHADIQDELDSFFGEMSNATLTRSVRDAATGCFLWWTLHNEIQNL